MTFSARSLLASAAHVAACLALAVPMAAHAWSQDGYSQRTRVTLNTSAAGVTTQEALSGVAVPLRLHSGNFDFLAARPDGSDLRVVAGDDKTPLKFRLERYDDTNQMAVLWVQLPTVAPGSDKNTVYVYAGNEKAVAEPAAPVYDAATLAAFSFGERDGLMADHTGTLKLAAPATPEVNGLIGPAVRLTGTALEWTASDRVKAASGAPYTLSLWVKPESGEGTLFEQGALRVGLAGGAVTATLGTASVSGGALPPAAWAQVGVVVGSGKLVLYVNGAAAGEAALPAAAPAIEGALRVGAGFTGQLDEIEVIGALRGADWMKFTRAAQGGDAKLVASTGETPDSVQDEGGEAGYIGILVKNLTLDAKIVIGILAVMFVIAAWVMVSKALFVGGIDRQNRRFLKGFRDAADVMVAEGVDQYPGSSLARLYAAGLRELQKRQVRVGGPALSGASIDAVKASVDADLVRENHRLNNQMVLLTIAISGGPFLGLLGTVVGVMITFAAIAAAGDVNVNAIAPGIAAALLATVAGLGVAIPALFGYNYLASRIKNVSADMQIFVDEFVTRVAESYGAR